MGVPSRQEYIFALRNRSDEALRQLQEARAAGDRAQVKAWTTVFRRINMLRLKAGDDLNQ